MNGSGILKQKAIWTTNTNELSQCWVLERLNYQKGDVNLDGMIDSDDATLVLQAFAESIQFTEVQKFLGDVNGDKEVNSDDAQIILKKFAGLD